MRQENCERIRRPGLEIPQPDFARGKLADIDRELPDELRAHFRSLVEDLHWHAHRRGWHPIRQYPVLADLVRGGWRGPKPSAEAMAERGGS